MQGFVVFDFADKYAEARKELAQWLSEGKLKRKETVIKGGINKAEEALVGLFEGKNTGKSKGCYWSCGSRDTNRGRQNYGTGCGSGGREVEVVEMGGLACPNTIFASSQVVFVSSLLYIKITKGLQLKFQSSKKVLFL
jgi:hypothetical protein